MKSTSLALILLGLGALAAGAWLLLASDEVRNLVLPPPTWLVEIASPLLIGHPEDPYAYAGGEAVRALHGQGTLRATDAQGALEASLQLDGASIPIPSAGDSPDELILHGRLQTADGEVTHRPIHGTTGRGDPRLPETQSFLHGTAHLDLLVDGIPQQDAMSCLWFLANALRREDGAIRNQGLIFSPLLRDDTVFADPTRLELTLLLYSTPTLAPGVQTETPVLHVVYTAVNVLRAPEDAQLPASPTPP